METVTSRDGTRIAFWRSGTGPLLLLVHGATADHTTTWTYVRPSLERSFTVLAMDRRGRGGSGDSPEYGLQREAEDVAAIVDSIGEPVSVLAHSFGALVALEASLLTKNINRLILYEGVYLRGADSYPPELVERLRGLFARGAVEDMLVAAFRQLAGMSPEEVELLRTQTDAWAVRLGNAPTLPRELQADESYVFVAERFSGMWMPVLFLVGGESPPRELENAVRIAAALPDARVAVLPGQQHVAMHTAPELFVSEVVGFLSDRSA
ncbi:MAG: alpha/beta fold hydrolase [Gemmatimonadaceae bacterium]